MVVNLNVPNVALDDVRGVRGRELGRFNEEWSAETTPGELLLEYVGHVTSSTRLRPRGRAARVRQP